MSNRPNAKIVVLGGADSADMQAIVQQLEEQLVASARTDEAGDAVMDLVGRPGDDVEILVVDAAEPHHGHIAHILDAGIGRLMVGLCAGRDVMHRAAAKALMEVEPIVLDLRPSQPDWEAPRSSMNPRKAWKKRRRAGLKGKKQ